jgi:hypothetical protein
MLHLSFGKIECNKLIILKSILRKWNHYFKVLLHLSKEEQAFVAPTGRTQLEIFGRRFKERDRWDDYIIMKRQLTIQVQNMRHGMLFLLMINGTLYCS